MTVTGGIDLLIAWCSFGVLLLALAAVLLFRGPRPGSEPTSGAPGTGPQAPGRPQAPERPASRPDSEREESNG